MVIDFQQPATARDLGKIVEWGDDPYGPHASDCQSATDSPRAGIATHSITATAIDLSVPIAGSPYRSRRPRWSARNSTHRTTRARPSTETVHLAEASGSRTRRPRARGVVLGSGPASAAPDCAASASGRVAFRIREPSLPQGRIAAVGPRAGSRGGGEAQRHLIVAGRFAVIIIW